MLLVYMSGLEEMRRARFVENHPRVIQGLRRDCFVLHSLHKLQYEIEEIVSKKENNKTRNERDLCTSRKKKIERRRKIS